MRKVSLLVIAAAVVGTMACGDKTGDKAGAKAPAENAGTSKKAEKTVSDKLPGKKEQPAPEPVEDLPVDKVVPAEVKTPDAPAGEGKIVAAPEKEANQEKEAQPAKPEVAEPTAPEAKAAPVVKEVKPLDELTFKHIAEDELDRKLAQFAAVPIVVDETRLTYNDKVLLKRLVAISNIMDIIFWNQTAVKAMEWRNTLASLNNPVANKLFHYVMINYGPWDRLTDFEIFAGEEAKPLGGAFYPEDMTKEEFEKWLVDHPEDGEAFRSNFTVIVRDGQGNLKAIPYSQRYEKELTAASRMMIQAVGITSNESLKKFLKSRAEAFLSNDYMQSDMDWMDLDSKIEITIGPYEVYEDRLLGYKASFESFVTVKDEEASQTLATFSEWAGKLEQHLPLADEHKNLNRGGSSPISVVDLVYSAGDTRAGIQTIAFNLPNDERVREAKGSKKVLMRNVMFAKFAKILTPIAQKVMAEELIPALHQEAFFHHTLMHEISHGIGPGNIKDKDGNPVTVSIALKEIYPHLEEAKADILGLYNNLFLIDQGVEELSAAEAGAKLSKEEARKAMLTTFVAGIFRSVRFGTEEAHGKANLLILNHLMAGGAILWNPETARFSIDFDKADAAVEACARELLLIEALGDYQAGLKFIEDFGKRPEALETVLATLGEVPVDIEPIFMIPNPQAEN